MIIYLYHEEHKIKLSDFAKTKRSSNSWTLPFRGNVEPQSLEYIHSEFRRLDILGEGRITYLNLRSALELREVEVDDVTVRKWMKVNDHRSKGFVDINDYVAIFKDSNAIVESDKAPTKRTMTLHLRKDLTSKNNRDRESTGEDILKRVFDRYDCDGDGYISVDDLRIAFQRNNQQCSEKELKQWVENRDLSGSGAVSFKDFVQTQRK